jgi:hypothetical protein
MDAESLLNPAVLGSAVAAAAGVASKVVAHWLESRRKAMGIESTLSLRKFDDSVAMREELWERIKQLEAMLATVNADLKSCQESLVRVTQFTAHAERKLP